MSVVWIWFGFVVLTFGLSISVYAIHNLYFNVDSFINVHNSLKSNSIYYDIHIINKPIEGILFNLLLTNYMCIVIIIYLIMQVASKLHF